MDDFALQPLDATETADFYELVVARHHKTSTVLTSNREPSEWLAMMNDALLAQSAIDLLTELPVLFAQFSGRISNRAATVACHDQTGRARLGPGHVGRSAAGLSRRHG